MAARSKAGSLPFLGVSEGLDLVKKVWGVTGLPMLPTPSSMAQFATRLPQTLPSMIAPTLDVDELDKRIADLRAVEQWLNLNLSMLRTTVQSLEVQRNTIATLKSFGGAMLAGGAATPPAGAVPNWPFLPGQPPAPMAGVPAPTPPAPAPAAPTPARARKRRGPRAAAAAAAAALPLNPTVWWNTLQEQFARIAATAAAEAQAAAAEQTARNKAAMQMKATPAEGTAARKAGGRKALPAKRTVRRRQPPPTD